MATTDPSTDALRQFLGQLQELGGKYRAVADDLEVSIVSPVSQGLPPDSACLGACLRLIEGYEAAWRGGQALIPTLREGTTIGAMLDSATTLLEEQDRVSIGRSIAEPLRGVRRIRHTTAVSPPYLEAVHTGADALLTLQRYFDRTVEPPVRRDGFFGLGFLRARTIGILFFFDSRAARLRR